MKRKLYIILIACLVIVFSNSIEVMMNVKDIDAYEGWLVEIEDEQADYSRGDYYESFVSLNLLNFFKEILVPSVFAIYSYSILKKKKVNNISIYIWTILLIASLAFTTIKFNFGSVFYYINIISYLIIIFTSLSLKNIVHDK